MWLNGWRSKLFNSYLEEQNEFLAKIFLFLGGVFIKQKKSKNWKNVMDYLIVKS